MPEVYNLSCITSPKVTTAYWPYHCPAAIALLSEICYLSAATEYRLALQARLKVAYKTSLHCYLRQNHCDFQSITNLPVDTQH